MKIQINIDCDFYTLTAALLEDALTKFLYGEPDENGDLLSVDFENSRHKAFIKISIDEKDKFDLKKDQKKWIEIRERIANDELTSAAKKIARRNNQ